MCEKFPTWNGQEIVVVTEPLAEPFEFPPKLRELFSAIGFFEEPDSPYDAFSSLQKAMTRRANDAKGTWFVFHLQVWSSAGCPPNYLYEIVNVVAQ